MTQIFKLPELHLKGVDRRFWAGQFDFDMCDRHDNILATIREPKPQVWKTLYRSALGHEYSAKHYLHANGVDGEALFAVEKHSWMRRESTSIILPHIGMVGSLKKRSWSSGRPHFEIVNEKGDLVVNIPTMPGVMNAIGWNFQVLDPQGVEIAKILQHDTRSLQSAPGSVCDSTMQFQRQLPDRGRVLLVAAFVAIAWLNQEYHAT